MRVGQPNPRNWRNVPRKPRYIWLLATRQLARKRQRSLMSLLITSPATVAAAATHLAGIGSALSTANAAAAAPTTALSVAGADEVSVLIAALFEAYAQEYQALSAQALAFHDQFVQALNMVRFAMRPQRQPTQLRCRLCRLCSRTSSPWSTRPPRHC